MEKTDEIILFETEDRTITLSVPVEQETVWLTQEQMGEFCIKQYIIEGYAINEKRLQALEKTVDIQTKMIADALDIEEAEVLKAVNEYTGALILLDKYDHQALGKTDGAVPIYRITYEDCKELVGKMRDSFNTDVFGVEKEAANLLNFMIKDHPYADGCKRIAASLFLEFLNRNNALFLEGKKRLSDGTLVAITLMIAESKADEKDIMVKMVMNLLSLS